MLTKPQRNTKELARCNCIVKADSIPLVKRLVTWKEANNFRCLHLSHYLAATQTAPTVICFHPVCIMASDEGKNCAQNYRCTNQPTNQPTAHGRNPFLLCCYPSPVLEGNHVGPSWYICIPSIVYAKIYITSKARRGRLSLCAIGWLMAVCVPLVSCWNLCKWASCSRIFSTRGNVNGSGKLLRFEMDSLTDSKACIDVNASFW